MVPAVLQPISEIAQWAFVIVCVPMVALVIMFVSGLLLVPKDKRIKAIKEMAKMARAIRFGKWR